MDTHAPADPVKNTFLPSSTTIRSTEICSGLSATSRFPRSSFFTLVDTTGEKNASSVLRGFFGIGALSVPPVDLRFFPVVVVKALPETFGRVDLAIESGITEGARVVSSGV